MGENLLAVTYQLEFSNCVPTNCVFATAVVFSSKI